MTKQELLKQCKFYRGEEACPFNDAETHDFWMYEAYFVNFSLLGESLKDALDDYKREGGKSFPIPDLLLSIMWHFWTKYGDFGYTGNISPFYEMVDKYIETK